MRSARRKRVSGHWLASAVLAGAAGVLLRAVQQGRYKQQAFRKDTIKQLIHPYQLYNAVQIWRDMQHIPACPAELQPCHVF